MACPANWVNFKVVNTPFNFLQSFFKGYKPNRFYVETELINVLLSVFYNEFVIQIRKSYQFFGQSVFF